MIPAQGFAFKLWPQDVHDFGYVEWVWHNLDTREKFMAEVEKHEAVYDEYKALLESDYDAAQKLLKDPTERGQSIRKALDLRKIYQKWGKKAGAYKPINRENKIVRWEDRWACLEKLYFNSITKGKCEDFPDWRPTEARLEDEATIKAHLEKQKQASQ